MGSASDLDILPRIIVALLLHCSLVSRGLFCMSGLQMDHALFLLRRDVLIGRMRGICRGGGQLRDLPRSEAKLLRTDLKCLFCPQFSSVQFGGSVPFHVLIGILATANFVLLKGQRPDTGRTAEAVVRISEEKERCLHIKR